MQISGIWRQLAAASSLLMISTVQADERLDTLTVVVTANEEHNLPLAVSTSKSEEQPAANEQSLQDFLDPAPGLFTQNQDNTAQGLRPSIRGFGSRAAFGVRGIRVAVDGVPMTLPDGQTDLDAIDLGLLKSATVIRGPSATLFGNAAGGAILLETRAPSGTPTAQLDLQAGSFGNQRIRIEGSQRFDRTDLLGAYVDADIDAPRDHAHTDTQLLNARIAQPLVGGRLNAWISTLDITSQDPGGLTADEVRQDRSAARDRNVQFDAGETIEQQRLALSWKGQLADWSLNTTGYAGQREFANRLPFTDGGQVAFDRSFGGFGSTLSKQFTLANVTHQVSTGVDAQLQQDERQRFENNDGQRGAQTLSQDEEAASFGIFIRDSIALNKRWSTSAGLRYDRLDLEVDDRFLGDGNDSGKRDIDNVSADISLSRHFDQHLLYARLATSYETPTLTELANPNGGGFNPDLESTEALNQEIGLKGQWRSLNYSLTLYQIDVEDELSRFELDSQPGRAFYRNAGETQRRGIEVSADSEINAQWSVSGSLSIARNEFESGALQGNSLPGIPDETLWLSANHQLGAWHSAIIGQYIGELYADDANTEKVDGYPLLHLQTAYALTSQWQIKVAVDNLLDEEYNDNIRINAFGGRYFEPAGGRSYRLAVSWRFI